MIKQFSIPQTGGQYDNMLQITYDLKTWKEVSRKAWRDPEKDVPLKTFAPIIAKMVMESMNKKAEEPVGDCIPRKSDQADNHQAV